MVHIVQHTDIAELGQNARVEDVVHVEADDLAGVGHYGRNCLSGGQIGGPTHVFGVHIAGEVMLGNVP